MLGSELSREVATPFEARHARRQALQGGRARSRTGAQFEHVGSQVISGNDPRQQMVARDALPEARGAKPIFECVHFSAPIKGRSRGLLEIDSHLLMRAIMFSGYR